MMGLATIAAITGPRGTRIPLIPPGKVPSTSKRLTGSSPAMTTEFFG
jgi:hypothetical protein